MSGFLANDAAGLYHLERAATMTLYQIAQVVNRAGGYDPALLMGMPRHQAGPLPPRAGNVSLCSDKLVRLLGGQPFHAWPLGEELQPTDRQWHFLRSAEQPGSLQFLAERLYRYPPTLAQRWYHSSPIP